MGRRPDRPTITGIIGKRGHGKTTLVRELTANRDRVLFWDWRLEGEYEGERVELRDLPKLFQRPTFRAVIQPHRSFTLVSFFDAVCSLVMDCAVDCTLSVDEAANVVQGRKEGGLGLLLRCSRPNNVSILWATQRPTGLPTTWLSESDDLYLFRLQHPIDLQALRSLVAPSDLSRLPTLPPFKCIHVTL